MEGSFMPIIPPCHILWPSTPSLTQNASQRAVLLPSTLCPAFQATEGFVRAHHALPHSKCESEGPFCAHLPAISHFERRKALFMPNTLNTPCLTRNTSWQVRSAPTTPSPTPPLLMRDGGEFTFTFDATRGNIPLITL